MATPVTRLRGWGEISGGGWVEMQLGRRYADTHLDWGEGRTQEARSREREETGPGLENSQSFKSPLSPHTALPQWT